MADAIFIYRNGRTPGVMMRQHEKMRGGPDKVIVYLDGVLCAMDRDAKITIPVSRWKLAEIGLACFVAALKGKGAAPRSLEPVPLPEPRLDALPDPLPDALPERLPEDTDRESSESEWERLMKEMRDLSR